MARRFLYLTNARLVALTTSGGGIAERHEYPVSHAGVAAFTRAVAGGPRTPTHIFTDLAEEDFRLDTIPHVRARDRGAIVNRKLGQLFRSTPFRYAQTQGREPDGRRDDRVMYTAVTNAEVLRPWVEALERREVPLEGIHSSAVVSARLLEAFAITTPHTLLVTFTPGDALRQSYFREGELRFSRLTPLDLVAGQSLGEMISEETTRTWQYLDSLRNFGTQDRLEVVVLVRAADLVAVQEQLRGFPQIHYTVLDLGSVAAKLGLKPSPDVASAEEALVQLFQKKPSPNHFATPEMRRFATLRRARLVLAQAAGVLLLIAVGFGAFNAWRTMRVDEADQVYLQQLARLGAETQDVTRTTPHVQESSGATMRDAVQFYNGWLLDFPPVGAFLRDISQVLQRHPQMHLTQVSWRASDSDKAQPVLAATPQQEALPVKAIGKTDTFTQPSDEVNPTFTGGHVEVALIEATLPVENNAFRAAAAQVDKLVADFETLPGVRAEIAEAPLELRPTFGLRGRHGELDTGPIPARFVVRVVRTKGAP